MTNIILSDNHAKTVEFVNAEITKLEGLLNLAVENFSNQTAKINEVYSLNAQLRTAKRLARVLDDNMSFSMTVTNLMPHTGMEMDDFTAMVIGVFVGV